MTISYSTTPKFAKSYFVHLCNCMGLKDGRVYDKNFIFENEHLLTLTPEDVVCYFNLKVFGTPNPAEDSCPKLGRSSSLCFYKKAISFFMPNKLLGWNVQIMSGNPTKSVIVNEVINKVKKMEVRRQGKSSQARRALTIEEFKFMISMMRKSEDPMKKIAVPALCSFQFHLIARIDDTCQFMLNELRAHDLFPFALRGRMRWSKNVLEERHCPSQIILGSNDTDFCVLLNVGLYLESQFPTEVNDEGILNCFSFGGSSTANTKKKASRVMRDIFKSDEFRAAFGDGKGLDGQQLLEWLVGSHSVRKLAATHARRNGSPRDSIDIRGRWKHQKRQVDVYVDTTVPYPDAQVCSALCVGGAIRYDLVVGSGLDDCWVLANVVPKISQHHYCNKAAAVFGRAVLWACFDPLASKLVPQEILNRVQGEYERVRMLDPATNPVRKVGLVVCGHEGQLFIDDLVIDGELAGGGAVYDESTSGATSATTSDLNLKRKRHNSELQIILSQLAVLRKQNEVLSTEFDIMKNHLSKKLKYISDTMNRFAAIPATLSKTRYLNLTTTNLSHPSSPSNPSHSTGEAEQNRAKLVRNPKSLYILWNEYEFGIGGRRPAKSFSKEERGMDRYNYYKRNIFWSLVVEMVQRGRSANESIDKIYQVYGYKSSVTQIIKKLQEDKKTHYRQFF